MRRTMHDDCEERSEHPSPRISAVRELGIHRHDCISPELFRLMIRFFDG